MLSDPSQLRLLVLVLALLLVLVALLLAWRLGRAGRRSRHRVTHALRGEDRAVVLLEAGGYEILERQASRHWHMIVDQEEIELLSRADFLVRRGGRVFVAEVKTGGLATDPGHPATRRQLLEYLFVFDPDGLILVDADACPVKNEIYSVAARHGLRSLVVSNSFIAVPRDFIEWQWRW